MANILVVEDDWITQQMLEYLLGKSAHSVVLAHNGQEGIYHLSKFSPDLVITDLAMPVVDVMDIVYYLRSTERYQQIPLILLTTIGDRQHYQVLQTQGPNHIITKPFKFDELLTLVDHACSGL